jgi:hypothetical protein
LNPLSTSDGGVTGAVRDWLRVEGVAVLALSLLLYAHSRSGWWMFIGLLLVPDLSMLGYLVNARVGGACYNVVHSYVLPVGLVAAAIAVDKEAMLPFLYIWTAHIGMDRALGYGLKYSSGFEMTHLGRLRGRAAPQISRP